MSEATPEALAEIQAMLPGREAHRPGAIRDIALAAIQERQGAAEELLFRLRDALSFLDDAPIRQGSAWGSIYREHGRPRIERAIKRYEDAMSNFVREAPPAEGETARALAVEIPQKDARIAELARELADEKRGRESARVTFNEDLRVMKEFADRKESESAGLRWLVSKLLPLAKSSVLRLPGYDDTIQEAEALAGKEAAGE